MSLIIRGRCKLNGEWTLLLAPRPCIPGDSTAQRDDEDRNMRHRTVSWLITLLIFTVVTGCATPPPKEPRTSPTPPPASSEHIGSGKASYYGNQHHNKQTASGERFDQGALTAAHRTLPFGTKVRVTNTRNGKSVVVRINDRGPFVRGRIIDLSKAAFERIASTRSGVVRVRLEKVD